MQLKPQGVDMLTIVGHKFGAPKGTAALYIRQGVSIHNLLYGGGQEGGRRAGTENVLLAVRADERMELTRSCVCIVHLITAGGASMY